MISMLEKLSDLVEHAQLDGVAFNAGPDLLAFTGLNFHISERPAVLFFKPGRQPVLVCPEFESGKASKSDILLDIVNFPEERASWVDSFKTALKKLGLEKGTIGVSPTSFRMLEYSLCQTASDECSIVSRADIFNAMRVQKTQREILSIRKAVEIAEHALEKTIPIIKVGVTEKEIAAQLTMNLLQCGSDPELPFSPIVASGANSANPHAFPGERTLQKGDVLIIDWGARSEGYISDLTRSFFIGQTNEKMSTIAKIVETANQASRNSYKADVTSSDVDIAARSVIEESGYGKFFNHRTGHGIGLEAHEEPYIQAGSITKLKPGMVFTIEPGIYLPGTGGIRIEDNIYITSDSFETISSIPRKVRVL